MRHHSPDFGESDYVWIYCLYSFSDAFTVNIRKMRRMRMQCVPGLPSSSPSEGLGTKLYTCTCVLEYILSVIIYVYFSYLRKMSACLRRESVVLGQNLHRQQNSLNRSHRLSRPHHQYHRRLVPRLHPLVARLNPLAVKLHPLVQNNRQPKNSKRQSEDVCVVCVCVCVCVCVWVSV